MTAGEHAARRLTIPAIRAMKGSAEPIVMVTAYDFATAQIVERAGVDLVLVGDSAAMVVLGHDGTVPVTMDEMIFMTHAVAPARRPSARRSREPSEVSTMMGTSA